MNKVMQKFGSLFPKSELTFLKGMVTSHSGISSKRVCGVLGWIVAIVVLLYCTIHVIQAP